MTRLATVSILAYCVVASAFGANARVDGAGEPKNSDGQVQLWTEPVESALERAGDDRDELKAALNAVPGDQRQGMAFLIQHMPKRDLASLGSECLLENVALAYKAKNETSWGKTLPENVFLNDVLPCANVNENRDRSRKSFYEKFMLAFELPRKSKCTIAVGRQGKVIDTGDQEQVLVDFRLVARADQLPVVFSDDFEEGRSRWETTDDTAWTHREVDGNHVFGLNRRKSDYQPKVRSPHNIAMIKDLELADFEVTFRVKSTKDTGGHRDCCVFFCHRDPTHFYYVHLGARPDPHSGQIMIVNDEPRLALTKNQNQTPWNDEWHNVKVVRESQSGKIDIYFDDMEHPHMSTIDKTFTKGRIGIGSFDDMNDFDDVVVRGR